MFLRFLYYFFYLCLLSSACASSVLRDFKVPVSQPHWSLPVLCLLSTTCASCALRDDKVPVSQPHWPLPVLCLLSIACASCALIDDKVPVSQPHWSLPVLCLLSTACASCALIDDKVPVSQVSELTASCVNFANAAEGDWSFGMNYHHKLLSVGNMHHYYAKRAILVDLQRTRSVQRARTLAQLWQRIQSAHSMKIKVLEHTLISSMSCIATIVTS